MRAYGEYDHVLGAADLTLWQAISEMIDTQYPNMKTFTRVVCAGWDHARYLPSPGPSLGAPSAATAFIEDVTEDIAPPTEDAAPPPELRISALEARLAALEAENQAAARLAAAREEQIQAHAEAVRQAEARIAHEQAQREQIEAARQEQIQKAATLTQRLEEKTRQHQDDQLAAARSLRKATRHIRRSLIAEVSQRAESIFQPTQASGSFSPSPAPNSFQTPGGNESNMDLDSLGDEHSGSDDDEVLTIKWKDVLDRIMPATAEPPMSEVASKQKRNSILSRSESGKRSLIV